MSTHYGQDAGIPAIHLGINFHAPRSDGESCKPDAQSARDSNRLQSYGRIYGSELAAAASRYGADWDCNPACIYRGSVSAYVSGKIFARPGVLAASHLPVPCVQ